MEAEVEMVMEKQSKEETEGGKRTEIETDKKTETHKKGDGDKGKAGGQRKRYRGVL